MNLTPILYCVAVACILLMFGTFMEGIAIAVLLVPVLWPIAQSMGINVIHFGMIVCVANVIGTMTPPVAVNIFAATTVSKLRMGDIAKAQTPFFIGYLAVFYCGGSDSRFQHIHTQVGRAGYSGEKGYILQLSPGTIRRPATAERRKSAVTVYIRDVRVICTAPEGINLTAVRIDTSEPGLYGLGCATFAYRHLVVKCLVEEYLRPLLIGRPVENIEDLWHMMHQNGYWRNGPAENNAVSGVDMALWDIKGKMADMPLYQLFGGKCREAVPVYRHVEGKDLSEICEDILRRQEQGITCVRCQCGGYGGGGFGNAPSGAPAGAPKGVYLEPRKYMRDTIALFEGIRERIGFDMALCHDVHERIHPMDAVRFAQALEPFDLFFLEDAVPWNRASGCVCCAPIRPFPWPRANFSAIPPSGRTSSRTPDRFHPCSHQPDRRNYPPRPGNSSSFPSSSVSGRPGTVRATCLPSATLRISTSILPPTTSAFRSGPERNLPISFSTTSRVPGCPARCFPRTA
jgi:hypothetical protein